MSSAPISVLSVQPEDERCCAQCNAIETACYPKNEVLNISHEASKPGCHIICSGGSANESEICLGYVIFQKTALSVSIVKIVVLPTYRRRGIGKQLLKTVEEFANLKSIRLCSLNVEESNSPAIALYLSEGYVKSDHRTDFYAIGRHAYRMEKEV